MDGSQSKLRYLFAIYEIGEEEGKVRSVDIARKIGVRRSSVNKMTDRLAGDGLIAKEYYGDVSLTSLGLRRVAPLYRKYRELCDFFGGHPAIKAPDARRLAVFFLSRCGEEETPQVG